jgi:hypothetical protein
MLARQGAAINKMSGANASPIGRSQGWMPAVPLHCPNCRTPVADTAINQATFQPCFECQSLLQVEVYPAMFRRIAPAQSGELALVEGESTCFYHATKKAVLPCHACGRFLCALCDCELNGEHFCPACLETGQSKGRIKNLDTRRTLWDSIALSLAVLPVVVFIFWFLTIVTAPMALFIAIRYWNAPLSIVRRTRIRYVLAIVLAAIQMTGWGILIYFLVAGFNAL